MKYQLAIFDLDGTILDTLVDLANSTNYALSENGFPTRSIDEVRCFVGNGIRKLIERAVPSGTSTAKTDEVFQSFTTYYKIHCADYTKPYDGIIEVLDYLHSHNIKTAVVSNKADFAVQSLCQDYFPGKFDYCVGEREGIQRKPSPDSVLEVLSKLSVDKQQAVYIGDSDVDIMTGKNAGMDILSVSYGFRDENFLLEHGATTIVDTPKKILDFL